MAPDASSIVLLADRTILDRRQQGNGGNNGSSSQPPAPPNGTQSGGSPDGQGAPLSVFTFIIAIALFVLVVSFVLLRIFVRNRRLRRMGIYPETPLERLLGGAPREYEDNLPQPKLWGAKIADVRANNSGALARAEKSVLGGGVGAGDVRQHGWDALMPVSAALPPSLYPVIYQQQDNKASNAAQAPTSNNAGTGGLGGVGAGRLGRHMPHFLRRNTGDADVTAQGDATRQPASETAGAAAGLSSVREKQEQGQHDATSHVDSSNEEKFSASVNVTVLIAMPSHKTVFPSSRRPTNLSTASLRRSTSRVNSSGVFSSTREKLEDVDEDVSNDVDALSFKGKARRAPSLRSIRTTGSTKSQAEARREAFFQQQAEDEATAAGDDVISARLPQVEPRSFDDEEEELPELVFGTASVPLFSKILSSSAALQSHAGQSTPTLISPTREEILGLVSTATEARTRKEKSQQAENERVKAEDGEADASHRRSNAGTSLEGGLSAAEDQNGLGDVVGRMMRTNDGSSEAYELGDMSRPSLQGGGGPSILHSVPMSEQASRATPDPKRLSAPQDGLMADMAPTGYADMSSLPTPMTATSDAYNESQPLFPATTPSVSTPGIAQTQFGVGDVNGQNGGSSNIVTSASSMHTARESDSIHRVSVAGGER